VPELSALTAEQRGGISKLSAEFLRQDFSTTPLDHPTVEAEINAAYVACGLKPPKTILWASSPLDGAVKISIVRALAKKHGLRTLSSRDRVINKITRKIERATVKRAARSLDPHLTIEAASVISKEVTKSALPAYREAFMRYQQNQNLDCICEQCQGERGTKTLKKIKANAHRSLAHELSARNRLHTVFWGPLETELRRKLSPEAINALSTAGNDVNARIDKQITEVINSLPTKLQAVVLKAQADNLDPNRYSYLYPLIKKYEARVHKIRGLRGGPNHPGLLGSYRLTFGHWATLAPVITAGETNSEFLGARVFNNSSARLWAYKNFAVVTQNPVQLFVDPQGRLHNATSACVRYADGFEAYAWHGTPVPLSLIRFSWSPEEIFKERNAELRRCAIEKMGWDEFIKRAKLQPVGPETQDPGNPGEVLKLYDVPENLMRDVRVLVCSNATIESDGLRRRFGLTVPKQFADPIEAAAWTFGVPVEEYRKLQRAC